jgi:hypothetical protein
MVFLIVDALKAHLTPQVVKWAEEHFDRIE